METIESLQERITDEKNGAMQVAELFGEFMRPVGSNEEELLKVVAHYALQLRGDQQQVLTRLKIASMDMRIPLNEREKLRTMIDSYQTFKRFHGTMQYINFALEAISLKRFWSQDAMKGQILKNQ